MFFCVIIKILKRKTKILLKKKGMFILLVIIIGFTFVIIFNLHHFRYFLLSMTLFYEKMVPFFSFFQASAGAGYTFLNIFNRFFLFRVYVSYVGSYYYCENGYHCFVFFLSVDCAGLYLSDHIRSFCYLEISFLFSNFV